MKIEIHDENYVLALSKSELKTIEMCLLFMPGRLSDDAFEDLIGCSKGDAEQLRNAIDDGQLHASRDRARRKLAEDGRIDAVLAEIESALARGGDAAEKVLKRQAGLRYNAAAGGYTEEEVLADVAIHRVLEEFEGLPEDANRRLDTLSREGTDPVRFVLADQWEGVDPDIALDALGKIYDPGHTPLLAGYVAAARRRIEARRNGASE